MRKLNHCLHGVTLNEFCPTCELQVGQFERWLGWPVQNVRIETVSVIGLVDAVAE